MSLPHNGSTAPVVTSPLLAWPARPSTRSSPLSTPSSDSFDDLTTSYPSSSRNASSSTAVSNSNGSGEGRWSSPKGKERALEAPQVLIYEHDGSEMISEERPRQYGPPKKPLPPHQLGRIAQSFGVIIPHLPQDPNPGSGLTSGSTSLHRPRSPASATSPMIPINGRSSPRLASHAPTRPSAFLLSVIPPTSLLPPTSAATSEQAHKRIKKWRRGRLLPLQPTLGSMLVCIAREYGLPSTVGLTVYLVSPASLRRNVGSSSSAASSFSSDGEEPSGPQVSSSTWSTLFSGHLTNGSNTVSTSRSSTPSHTPVKDAEHSGSERDMAYPPSPLSVALKTSTSQPTSLGHRPKFRSLSTEPRATNPGLSHSSHPSEASSSAILPPTPASLGTSFSTSSLSPNPIVGTIEFDVDLEEATWFEGWQKAGGSSRHKRSLTNEGGMKELNLVNKVGDERPRFLKELDVNRPSPERRRVSVKEHEDMAVSASASFDRFTETADSAFGDNDDDEGKDNDMVMLAPNEAMRGDLLASPINLAPEEEKKALDAATSLVVQEILQKRGSGLVMAEQLDDLEKIMRQLSPREIRLTSPRLLTPRMAAKVATLALPAVPRRTTSKAAPSPLAGGFVSPNPDQFEYEGELDSPGPNSATGSTHTFGSTRPNMEEREIVEDGPGLSSLQSDEEKFEPPKPSWPAVPFHSPDSPTSVQEYFARPVPVPEQRNVSSPASISSETMRRMQAESQDLNTVKPVSSEWIPRRPARPPSPKLEHQRTLSHTLSPELVDFLHRSPPPTSAPQYAAGTSPGAGLNSSPRGGAGVVSPDQKPRRSGSISLKGLRHQMSSKNLSHMWKNDVLSPPLPANQGREKEMETVGLFRGGLGGEGEMYSAHGSSFPGLSPDAQGLGQHMGQGFGFGPVLAQTHGQRSVSNPTPSSAAYKSTDFGPSPPFPEDLDGDRSPTSVVHGASGSGSGSGSGSLPSKSGKFASRIFGFRKHDTSEKDKDKGDRDNSKERRSRRQPSNDTTHSHHSHAQQSMLNISSPIASSFVHTQTSFGNNAASSGSATTPTSAPESATLPNGQSHSQTQAHAQIQMQQSLGHGRLPSNSQPQAHNQIPPPSPQMHNTPASPHSVRRKPVPGSASGSGSHSASGAGVGLGLGEGSIGYKNSMSLGSMTSFVLEDAPKGRRS